MNFLTDATIPSFAVSNRYWTNMEAYIAENIGRVEDYITLRDNYGNNVTLHFDTKGHLERIGLSDENTQHATVVFQKTPEGGLRFFRQYHFLSKGGEGMEDVIFSASGKKVSEHIMDRLGSRRYEYGPAEDHALPIFESEYKTYPFLLKEVRRTPKGDLISSLHRYIDDNGIEHQERVFSDKKGKFFRRHDFYQDGKFLRTQMFDGDRPSKSRLLWHCIQTEQGDMLFYDKNNVLTDVVTFGLDKKRHRFALNKSMTAPADILSHKNAGSARR